MEEHSIWPQASTASMFSLALFLLRSCDDAILLVISQGRDILGLKLVRDIDILSTWFDFFYL